MHKIVDMFSWETQKPQEFKISEIHKLWTMQISESVIQELHWKIKLGGKTCTKNYKKIFFSVLMDSTEASHPNGPKSKTQILKLKKNKIPRLKKN